MLDVLHYSSRALKRISIAILATTVLSGCSMTATENNGFRAGDKRSFFEKLKKEPTIDGLIAGSTQTYVEKTEPETTDKIGLVVDENVKQNVEAFKIDTSNLSRANINPDTAACRYLRNNANAEAEIVGSPTVSASSDEDGSGSVSIGMNLLDFRKADLIRATGNAKCRLHSSSKNIEATLGLGAEATRFARAWAKQDFIRRNLGNLNAVRARANALMQQGTLTAQDANAVAQRVAELKSEMELSAAQANQRKDLPALDVNRIRSGHGALIEATNDLQNIEREIRTNDALELSVSTGYRYKDTFNDNLQSTDAGGAFARVSVGVRLGALSAQRQQFEQEAASARLDSLLEENTGTIWKSGFSDRAMGKMVADLQLSEKQQTRALAKTESTISKLGSEERPEVIRAMLMAKIDNVRIGSDRAATRAAIKQLKNNRSNVQALSE